MNNGFTWNGDAVWYDKFFPVLSNWIMQCLEKKNPNLICFIEKNPILCVQFCFSHSLGYHVLYSFCGDSCRMTLALMTFRINDFEGIDSLFAVFMSVGQCICEHVALNSTVEVFLLF